MEIIVVGAQGAGLTCALKLQRNIPEASITIIEKTDYVSFGACGLPYYVGEFFNDTNHLFSRTPKDILDSGIHLKLRSEIININHKDQTITVKHNDSNQEVDYSYDKLVIATGSHSNMLPETLFTGANRDNKVFDFKDLKTSQSVKDLVKSGKKNIGVIGAGFIGLELLEAFGAHDCNVHLFDNKSKVSENFIDSEFEDIMQEEIAKHSNFSLHLSASIDNINFSEEGVEINYNDKDTVLVDFIVVAIGFTPNTSFVNKDIIDCLPNGAIVVNNLGETNIENIYACGDCAAVYNMVTGQNSYIPLATVANKLGRTIADAIADNKTFFNGSLASSCLKLLDLEIAKTGITEAEAKRNKINVKTAFIKDYNHTNYYPNQLPIWIKLVYEEESNILLGAQIAGTEGAMLRIHALSVAIAKKVTTKELGMIDLAYAPPFNRTWDILNIAGNASK